MVQPPRVIPASSPEQHPMEVPSEQSYSAETWVPSISRQDPGGRKEVKCVINIKKTRNTTAVVTETLVEAPGLLIVAAHGVQAALSTAAIKVSRQGEGGEYRRDLRALPRDVVEQISVPVERRRRSDGSEVIDTHVQHECRHSARQKVHEAADVRNPSPGL